MTFASCIQLDKCAGKMDGNELPAGELPNNVLKVQVSDTTKKSNYIKACYIKIVLTSFQKNFRHYKLPFQQNF